MSHELGQRAIEHVVLERGEVANTWRTERWDSLRLLTPNWMCRLPGHRYDGDDPDGYMARRRGRRFRVGLCAAASSAPVLTHTTVMRVAPDGGGYRVSTNRGDWPCRAVVLANGAFSKPMLPRVAERHARWRGPAVGASTTATPSSSRQAACWSSAPRRPACSWRRRSSAAAGPSRSRSASTCACRASTAAATSRVDARLRRARPAHRGGGRPDRARRVPSPQLVGTPERATLDLNALHGARRRGGRPPGRHPRRQGAVLRARCATSARWPT